MGIRTSISFAALMKKSDNRSYYGKVIVNIGPRAQLSLSFFRKRKQVKVKEPEDKRQ